MSKYICIFCGSSEKLSREHIWADWLRNYLPRTEARATHYVAGSNTGGNIMRGKLNRPGDLHAQRLQVVCKQCNNVWMGNLQELAKPHIIALLSDWVTLSVEASAVLAAWATMFTMVNEFADPDTAKISQQQRNYFMQNRATPPGWTVWIGRVDLQAKHPAIANHHGATIVFQDKLGINRKVNFQSTGFSVGNILFQTLMLDDLGINIEARTIADQFGLRILHPFHGDVQGDEPPKILDRSAFFRLSNGFASTFGLPAFATGPTV
ncbi:hypothetical protein [Novosphingobium pokkalii]|uniref:HNH endonuclease n=1 Tax=Novosphingobium pokkalii TaxID=1770194 RepID=A0ABV7V1Y3_9SPHN|nr:hypothetical protein [Novosphingobium pokkalii]